MSKEIKRISLDKLQVTFDVRIRLSEDRVQLFMELYQGGAELPPLQVSVDNEVIDGRHRLEALRRLKRAWAPCIVTREKSRQKLLAMAIEANMGGPMQPTRDDIIWTMERCLNEGMPRPAVISLFPLPAEVVRRYLATAHANMLQKRKLKAIAAIAGGNITVSDAAEKFGIPVRNLSAAVRRVVKRKETSPAAQFRDTLNKKWRGVPVTVSQLCRHVLNQCETGEVPWRTADAMLTEMARRVAKVSAVVEANRQKLKKFSGKK
ncbi:MAG: ParB/RepB/Spo0J family partition protein [Candidatus Komeilibacteria bacterium]